MVCLGTTLSGLFHHVSVNNVSADAVTNEKRTKSAEYISENLVKTLLDKQDPEKILDDQDILFKETQGELEKISITVPDVLVVNEDNPLKNENVTNHLKNSKYENISPKLAVEMANHSLVSDSCKTLRNCLNQNMDAELCLKGTEIVFLEPPQLSGQSSMGFKLLLTNTDKRITSFPTSTEMSEVPQENHSMLLDLTGESKKTSVIKMSDKGTEYIGNSEEIDLQRCNKKEPTQAHIEGVPKSCLSSKKIFSDNLMNNKSYLCKGTTQINDKVEEQNLSSNDKREKTFDDYSNEKMFLKSLNLLDLVQFKKVEQEIQSSKVSDFKCQTLLSRTKNKSQQKKSTFKDKNKKRYLCVSKSLFHSKDKLNNDEGSVLAPSSLSVDSSNKVSSKSPHKMYSVKESFKYTKPVSASTPQLSSFTLNESGSERSSCVESPVTSRSKEVSPSLKSVFTVQSKQNSSSCNYDAKSNILTIDTSCQNTVLDLQHISPHTKLKFVNQSTKRFEGVPEEVIYATVKQNENQQSVKKCLFDQPPEESCDQKNNELKGQLIDKSFICYSSALPVANLNNSQHIVNLEVIGAEQSTKTIKRNNKSTFDSSDEPNTELSIHSSSDEDSVLFWDYNEKSKEVLTFPSEVSRIKFDDSEQDDISENIYNSNFSTMDVSESIPSTPTKEKKERLHGKCLSKPSLLAFKKKKILGAVQTRNFSKKQQMVLSIESDADKILSVSDLVIANDKPKQMIPIPSTSLKSSENPEKVSLVVEESGKSESVETTPIPPNKKPSLCNNLSLSNRKRGLNKVSSKTLVHSCDYCSKEFKSYNECKKHNLKCHSHNLFY